MNQKGIELETVFTIVNRMGFTISVWEIVPSILTHSKSRTPQYPSSASHEQRHISKGVDKHMKLTASLLCRILQKLI